MKFKVFLSLKHPVLMSSLAGIALTIVFLITAADSNSIKTFAQNDYNLQEIKDGVYVLSAGGYNVMFLTTGQGVIVVDAPPSIGDKILEAVSGVTDEPIKYLVYSHAHRDHIGAAAHLFQPGVEIMAEKNTADILATANDTQRPVPTTTFVDNTTLELGNKTLQLTYPGQYHQRGNIFIYNPEQKVLMAVDQLSPGEVPWKHLAATPEVPALMKSYDQVLGYEFDVYVPGHGEVGTKEDINLQKEYVTDLKNNSHFAISNVNYTQVTENIDKQNNAAATEAYFNAITNVCVDKTEEKWEGRLQGVGVWTDEHCEKMIQSVRVD